VTLAAFDLGPLTREGRPGHQWTARVDPDGRAQRLVLAVEDQLEHAGGRQGASRGIDGDLQVRSDDPNEDGRYGSDEDEQWIYDHAIATMAMAELLAMSGDVINLKRSVTDAVKLCLRAQNSGFGWK